MFPYFLIRLKYFAILKSIDKGSQESENPSIIQFGGFGPSDDKTEILLDQHEAEQFPEAFKPILF